MVKTALTTHVRVIIGSTLAAAIHAAAFYGYPYHDSMSGAAEQESPVNLEISFTLQPSRVVQEISQSEEQPQTTNIDLQETDSQSQEPVKNVVKQEMPIKPIKGNQVLEKKPSKIAIHSVKPVIQKQDSVSQPVIVVEDVLAVQKQQDLFINELLDQIENNKFYPKKAKRRNIQGTVRVELSLDDTGKLVSLQLFEGHKILRKATATAIQATAPFSAPPSSLTVPQTIKFGVHYQFR
ncbi:MAG: TonB family protein [Gammaproteobacteria bacterium]|nr:TonB family protein [Gammaproteobacteria bacterium]